MPSWRPNIEYIVSLHPKDEYVQAAVSYIKDRVRHKYRTADRAMIFCRSTQQADAVALMIDPNLTAYHSGVPIEQRGDCFDKWEDGRTPMIVCTTLLGPGIDISGVRDVIHIDVPYSVVDCYQDDNRGGRDGLPSRAIIFAPEDRPQITFTSGISFGSLWLVPYLFSRHCRRLLFGLFLDGVGITCTAIPKATLCDNCARQLHEPPPAIPVRMPVAYTPEALQEVLSEWFPMPSNGSGTAEPRLCGLV